MNKLTGWVARAALVVSAIVVSVGASAQVLSWTDNGTKITGAKNVLVLGSYYDVVLTDVFVPPPAFSDRTFSDAASLALIAQVFVSDAPFLLDSTPVASIGCSYGTICRHQTFYSMGNGLFNSATAYNLGDDGNDFWIPIAYEGDATAQQNWINSDGATGTVWIAVTAVPEPETYALMLAGLGIMGTVARRRKAKLA